MNKRSISMLLAFVVITLALSIATMAYEYHSASADASGASATVSVEFANDLLARASINSLLYSSEDGDSGEYSASASVSASDLQRTDIYPPKNSYAKAWIGEREVEFKSWSD